MSGEHTATSRNENPSTYLKKHSNVAELRWLTVNDRIHDLLWHQFQICYYHQTTNAQPGSSTVPNALCHCFSRPCWFDLGWIPLWKVMDWNTGNSWNFSVLMIALTRCSPRSHKIFVGRFKHSTWSNPRIPVKTMQE